jgi:hypothetical protein
LAANEAIKVRDAADDAAAQEAYKKHENDTQHQLPCCAKAERGLQEVLKEEPDAGADQRPE